MVTFDVNFYLGISTNEWCECISKTNDQNKQKPTTKTNTTTAGITHHARTQRHRTSSFFMKHKMQQQTTTMNFSATAARPYHPMQRPISAWLEDELRYVVGPFPYSLLFCLFIYSPPRSPRPPLRVCCRRRWTRPRWVALAKWCYLHHCLFPLSHRLLFDPQRDALVGDAAMILIAPRLRF